jgi:hypothetical protein
MEDSIMKTYLALKFYGYTSFYILLRVKEGFYNTLRESSNTYGILDVVVGNDDVEFMKHSDGIFRWRYNEDSSYMNVIDLNSRDDFIIQLPDDDSALLWFKLNYGG